MCGRTAEVEFIDCCVTDRVFEWKKEIMSSLKLYMGAIDNFCSFNVLN